MILKEQLFSIAMERLQRSQTCVFVAKLMVTQLHKWRTFQGCFYYNNIFIAIQLET